VPAEDGDLTNLPNRMGCELLVQLSKHDGLRQKILRAFRNSYTRSSAKVLFCMFVFYHSCTMIAADGSHIPLLCGSRRSGQTTCIWSIVDRAGSGQAVRGQMYDMTQRRSEP
jgi:hypothetical protein